MLVVVVVAFPDVLVLVKALDLWYTIEDHLKRVEVKEEHVDWFPAVLDKFESNINEFYECGTDTFLSGNKVGKDETYYLHALKYYIPVHGRKTWEDHKCGIGVFTMQGFERRNKESKNILRSFNNMEKKILSQILKRLRNSFFYNNDHVRQEIVEDIVDDLLREDNNNGDGDDGS